MKLTKEQLVIISLTLAFIAMSCMYFQSLVTIEKMYTSSVIQSLESDISRNAFVVLNEKASSTVTNQPVIETQPIIPAEPVYTLPVPNETCYRGGCSGQLCGDESIKDIATTCEWREEYACYAEPIGICERQADGQCGWTETDELNSCLNKSTEVNETEVVEDLEIQVI